MSHSEPLRLGDRPAPRCYTRPATQAAAASAAEGAASTTLAVLSALTGIAVFVATYAGWLY
jgi:hypothetical protein